MVILKHENEATVCIKCQNKAQYPSVRIVLVKVHLCVPVYLLSFTKDPLVEKR